MGPGCREGRRSRVAAEWAVQRQTLSQLDLIGRILYSIDRASGCAYVSGKLSSVNYAQHFCGRALKTAMQSLGAADRKKGIGL